MEFLSSSQDKTRLELRLGAKFNILSSMENLRKIFFRGLVTFLPIAITIYILYAGVLIVDNLLGSAIRWVIPETYIPGLGFVLTLLLVLFLGFLLNNLVIGEFLKQAEKKFLAVPLVRTVYGPLRDLMNLFSKQGGRDLKSVVLVELGDTGMKSLGLVTRESFRDLESHGIHGEGKVTVYIPWSYGVGGLTFLVPRNKITPVDMPVDRALTLAITAWVKTTDDDAKTMGSDL